MNFLLIICLILCIIAIIALSYILFVLWKKYWLLLENISSVGEQINKHNVVIKHLAKREILSNDQTVVSFIKHINAVTELIDTFDQINNIENILDDNEEEN